MRYIRWIHGVRCVISVMVCFVLFCVGCNLPVQSDTVFDPEKLGFWKPYLLYLQSTPCQSLYVEVDAVQGCEPSQESIEALHQFLLKYCDKPAGIQIVKGDPIHVEDANALDVKLLALRHMAGPNPSKYSETTAYLYILFYDSSLLSGGKYPKGQAPYVDWLMYPAAVYMDRRYFKKHHASEYEAKLLLHEVGHVLGLTRNQTHGDGKHCRDKSCIMHENYKVSLFRKLTFQKQRQEDICELCKKDLERAKTSERDPKLKFLGPALVRSEEGYHVLSLPSFVRVEFGSLKSLKWQDVLHQAQNIAPQQAQMDKIGFVMATGDLSGPNDLLSLQVAIEKAENDPYRLVSLTVKEMKEELMEHITHILDEEEENSK